MQFRHLAANARENPAQFSTGIQSRGRATPARWNSGRKPPY